MCVCLTGLGHQAGVAAVTKLDSMVASCLKDDDGNDSDTDLDDPSLLVRLKSQCGSTVNM